jgi:hypothetical protein
MANWKMIGTLLSVGGVILLLVSLLADTLGLAGSAGLVGHQGLGLYQILGAGAGAIVTVVGIALIYKK